MDRRHRATASLAAVLCVLAVAASQAQTAPPAQGPRQPEPKLPARVFVDLNGGYQSASMDFSDRRDDPFFGESATWTADYAVQSGPSFDVAGGVRLWRNLAARVGYSLFEDSRIAGIAGEVPHPFFFNQNRGIAGEAQALKQQEHGIHLGALWTTSIGRHVELGVFGGPTVFRVARDLVEDVSYAEVGYPYDAAAFGSATVARVSETAIGFHAGADVTWMFSRAVGVGGVVRFARASASLDSPANSRALSLDLGGLQVGAGLRIRLGGGEGGRKGTESATPRPPTVHTDQPAPERPSERPRAEPQPRSGAPLDPDRVSRLARLRTDTPVYVRPDALTPLRILPAGTSVTVRDEAGDWLLIEFRDPQWGTRVGYVRRTQTDW